jgi:hypothetical protein
MADKDFEKEYKEAVRSAKKADENEPRAKKAFYDAKSERIVVELKNGCTFLFPPELAEGLQGASKEVLSDVQITPSGAGLHFEKADAHFSLPGLLLGIFGTKSWMAEMGKRGGSASTKATRQTARENGKRGGRPKKDKAA